MSIQSDALLAVAGGYMATEGGERMRREGELWRSPIVCTPAIIAEAEQDAEVGERVGLRTLRKRGLLVVSDTPSAELARLTKLRASASRLSVTAPGARGRQHGKGGKRK